MPRALAVVERTTDAVLMNEAERLGATFVVMPTSLLANWQAEAARRHSDRLPERERLLIEGEDLWFQGSTRSIEFARRVLPHSVRPSFNETEQFCRAATAGGGQMAQAA